MDKDYWNDVAGPSWVRDQQQLDAMLVAHANSVIAAAELRSDHRVVDIGCGCGALTLQASELAASAVGVDVSRPMLARARERATQSGSSAQFIEGDAQTHSFESGSFDRLLSRFGVMFFADPSAAFRNMHGWLTPGGRITFVCWQSIQDNTWMSEPGERVAQFITDPPPPAPEGGPGPFSLADPITVHTMLGACGFHGVDIDQLLLPMRVEGDIDAAVHFYSQRGSVQMALNQAPDKEPVLDAVRAFVADHHDGSAFSMDGAAWLVSATR